VTLHEFATVVLLGFVVILIVSGAPAHERIDQLSDELDQLVGTILAEDDDEEENEPCAK